ncbi:MAG TPA: two-component regulator propeller domain-containing protein, partial [Candidatus Synoicihabitans sp.]|nr:two-component regulator propeller domain-containing protein [Candidatus Synoicihabitans sp.]
MALSPPRFFLLALLGATLSHAFASPVSYSHRSWTTDDGLPHNAVTRILQDRAGFLWFGTPGGLARFDGRTFRAIELTDGPPPSTSNIRGLAEEPHGALAVLTSRNRLLRVTVNAATPHPAETFLARLRGEPVDLYVESSGAVWVATTLSALMRWHPTEGAIFFGREAPLAPRTKRFSFATDGDGTTWVATDGYLAAFSDGELRTHPDAPASAMLLAPSASGALWIASKGQLLKLRDRQLEPQNGAVPWQGDFDSVRHLMETRRGDLLVTGRRSILRYRDGAFTHVPTPYPLVNYILEDHEENLWLGTHGSGTAQLLERYHRIFNHNAGLSEDSVSALAEDADGHLWVANRTGGLHRLDPRQAIPHRDQIASFPVDVVVVDAQGHVWFGGPRVELWRQHSSAREAQPVPVPAVDLNALLTTRSGAVWFATQRGVIGRHLGDEVELLDERHGYTLNSVYALAEADDGSIWLGGR